MKQLPSGAVRIVKLALPKEQSYNLVNTINYWLKSSGLEWTVARLKALRNGAYQLKAGNHHLAREIWQKNSIAYHKGKCIPKGIFGTIIAHYVAARMPKILRRYDALLRLYTCIYSTGLTWKQFTKAEKAINTDFLGDPKFLQLFSTSLRKYLRTTLRKYRKELRITTDLSLMRCFSSTHKECEGDIDMAKQPWGRHVMSLWTSVFIPDALKPLNPAEKLRSLIEKSGANCDTVGHISFIQEGGAKARVVAVPNVWVQLLFKNLDDRLDRICKTIPESCCHDQNKGAYFLTSNIKRGNTVFCYDLSSATDRFPRSIQRIVLEALGLPEWSLAIEQIAGGTWEVKTKVESTIIDTHWSYNVGQPQGLYSSFKLFHLTHILILKQLESLCGANDSFRILGDDVIISNKIVAKHYKTLLSQIGMEVSPTKTIISDRIGEFAGFVGLKTNQSACVYRPLKYSGNHGFGAAVPLISSMGSRVKSLGNWYAANFEYFNYSRGWRNPDLTPLYSLNDDLDKPIGRLNSHLLGSLSNRFSYSLSYEPLQDIFTCYEEQQIILLGQKEKVNSEGFASASDNSEIALGANLDTAICENHSNDSDFGVHKKQVSSDPLLDPNILAIIHAHTHKTNDVETVQKSHSFGE